MFTSKKSTKYDRIDLEADGHEVDDKPKSEQVEQEGDTAVEDDADVKEKKEEVVEEDAKEKVEELKPIDGAIILNVKGTDDKTHKVQVSEQASVTDLKNKIASVTEFSVERQRLIYLGRMLDDALKLCDYNIKDGNFVHLVPKPAGFVNRASSGDTTNISLEEGINITLPDNLGAFRESAFRSHGGGGRYSEDYMHALNLSLWRARVRLLGSLMLFYYFLQFMTNLSFWMHPDQADVQYQHGHHPTGLYFAVDAVENVFGMAVAWMGLKNAACESTTLSKRFFRRMRELCFVHFLSLTFYTEQVLSGQIQIHTRMHSDPAASRSELIISVFFNFMVNAIMWLGCIGIAARYHAALVHLVGEDENVDTTPIEPESENESAPTVVVSQ